VAVGGDGTWSNVGNAILRSGVPVALGLVPGGTGCDLAKTLGIPPRDVGACCRIVLDGETRAIDVGRIEDKHFLNIAGFGYDVAVLEDSWNVAYLEGGALYLYCALRQLGSYRGFSLETEVDGRPLGRSDMLMVIVANARIFGGGFRVAPHADIEDGKLDAIAFGNMGFAGRVSALVRLLRGTHVRHPRVTAAAAKHLVYRFEAPPAYETDGEWNQARSSEVVVEAVPRALRVLVPPR
jgi:YegS/Rv2252/BmrU family lipid kinase